MTRLGTTLRACLRPAGVTHAAGVRACLALEASTPRLPLQLIWHVYNHSPVKGKRIYHLNCTLLQIFLSKGRPRNWEAQLKTNQGGAFPSGRKQPSQLWSRTPVNKASQWPTGFVIRNRIHSLAGQWAEGHRQCGLNSGLSASYVCIPTQGTTFLVSWLSSKNKSSSSNSIYNRALSRNNETCFLQWLVESGF